MLEAAFWGGFASASLLLGALIAYVAPPAARPLGIIMAFGAGTLLSAVSFEMLGASVVEGDTEGIAVGLLVGSLTYFGADWFISRIGSHQRKKIDPQAETGSGMGLVLGTILDGVPESLVTGMSFAGGGGASVALIVSVFASNLPEAIASTMSLKKKWSAARVYGMWLGIVSLCTVAAALGYVAVDSTSGISGTRIEAFAAGAILTMLAQTMMPEAFEHGGRVVGVATVLGFTFALLLTVA